MARGEGVKQLKDLFQKYRERLVAPEATVRDAFVEVVEDVVGIKIAKESVLYVPHNKTISLKVSGVVKQEVFFHKEEIITHLKGRIGVKAAPKEII